MQNFLIGFLLGCIMAMGYYDGFVAKDYKEAIRKYEKAMEEADSIIVEKIGENDTLKRYLLEITRRDKAITKKI
jgi:hypothetical protein